MDDAPPPPYSETDIYSRSGRSPTAHTGANDDNASVTASSSRSTTIYTPPETPRESNHNFTGNDDHHTIISIHSYFESRPALGQTPSQNFVVSLPIAEDASPDDFPYPGWASSHDTTEQDWQTFLNYVLPDHASRANSHVVECKLQAQDDSKSSTTEKNISKAQLDQIKSSFDQPSKSRHDIDATIREWNDGFFGPRGVTIHRTDPQTPTSRTPAPQYAPTSESQPQSQSQPQPQERGQRQWWNPFRPFEATSRGLRIGNLAIDGDRVSFGNSFEVDRNGVRWNGESTNRSPPPVCIGPDFTAGPGHPNCGDYGMGRGRGGRWWRPGHGHHSRGSRGHSPSSDSSPSSSDSDSDSDSSIGSLPDWDDLKDSQLPVTKQSVSAWLAHPEQPVTREMLKAVRANIKAAKNATPTRIDPDLRQEVKALLAQVKELKREQKRSSRAIRREKRGQKRALKRERRSRRKAEKRERRNLAREVRSAEREAGRGARRGGLFPSFPPAPVTLPIIPPCVPSPDSHSVGGPGFPFGSGGFGGGPSFPFGRGARPGRFGHHNIPRPWEAHIQRAQQQVEQARAFGQAQADMARAEARRVSADAQRIAAQAQAHAEQISAHAQAQARAAAWSPFGPRNGAFFTPPPPPPPPLAHRRSWPQQQPEQHHSSAAEEKYRAADVLKAQVAEKKAELRSLKEEIDKDTKEDGSESENESDGKKLNAKELKAQAMEEEIRTLEQNMNALTLEAARLVADEELARSLQEEEDWLGR